MTFDQALAAIDGVEGWLSEDQARRLWDAAVRAPACGRIVEIGSFRGRSAIVLARAAAPGTAIVAVDPHQGSDRGPQEYAVDHALGNSDRDAFEANLVAAGVRDRIRHVRRLSSEALDDVKGPIDVLYVDGAHRFGPARDDIRRWGDRVAPGGALLIHDAFSSIGVTMAIAVELLGAARWRYAGRSRSLAEFTRLAEPAGALARVGNATRLLASLPWFARNVAIKAAILLGRPALAQKLGHRAGDPWPY